MYKVDNAVIMAAGTSSRFAPLSYECHKGLIPVRGEVLIERQIRQLREAGIMDICVVTGYRAEDFAYLEDKFGVTLRHNPLYATRNNNASIYVVRDLLKNTYICSADNYFSRNPFQATEEDAYYAALYAEGETKEWCMTEDEAGYINSVVVGGRDAWYMLGQTFWSEDYSHKFVEILEAEYDLPQTVDKLWEDIYMEHLDELRMKMKKYPQDVIYEFDTLDELREFDPSYVTDTRSHIIKDLAVRLRVTEDKMHGFTAVKSDTNEAIGVRFTTEGKDYTYMYETQRLEEI